MERAEIIATPDTLNGALETWFIQNVVFQGLPYSLNFQPQKVESSTVIYLELYQLNLEFISQVRDLGKKLVLYHMGDERGDKDLSGYQGCDLIIRNYYFPHVFDNPNLSKKILWSPNGFRTGVGPRQKDVIKNSLNRQCLASFLGWINNPNSYQNERIDFASAAANCGEDLYLLSSPGFASGYNVGLYSGVLEDSVFAPCPAGNSPETIRLYDALELGSIPIMLKQEFLLSNQALASIGPVPFPLLNTWAELPDFLARMKNLRSERPSEIQVLQTQCLLWWENYKYACRYKKLSH